MPIEAVPSKSGVLAMDGVRAENSWITFFVSVFYALFGWKRSYTALKTFDFGNIASQGQATTTVAALGARQGDAVVVTAKTQVAGLGVFGYVSANDTVTIVRFNYSAGAIDPASDDFRVVVLQQ